MKKIRLLIIVLFSLLIVGCTPTRFPEEDITLKIYALNDFHGAVFADNGGLNTIASYLINEKAKDSDHTIILSSGDMFQGSAISNMTQGSVVVEVMNKIGFDSMTIGNHEFDWGVDVIKKYHDKTSEVVCNFPILCANIYEKSTNQPVDWCDPYTIIEKAGLKIGIIGIIGSELTSSISPTIVAPYEFKPILPIIKQYAKELRTEKNCDVVLVSSHDNTNDINQSIADLMDEYQVDAIFNGHTHSNYSGETKGCDNIPLPYVQSGSSGSYIGKVELTIDGSAHKVKDGSAENIKVRTSLAQDNKEVADIIEKYNATVTLISDEVLGVCGRHVNKASATLWAANVIRDYSKMEIGIINTGGIRGDAFPIEENEQVTVGKVWTIMPFDNIVKTCTLKVKDIIKLAENSGLQVSDNIEIIQGELYIDGSLATKDSYTVATIDYLFDNTKYPFLTSQNQVNTGILFRDQLIQAIKDTCKDGSLWYVS